MSLCHLFSFSLSLGKKSDFLNGLKPKKKKTHLVYKSKISLSFVRFVLKCWLKTEFTWSLSIFCFFYSVTPTSLQHCAFFLLIQGVTSLSDNYGNGVDWSHSQSLSFSWWHISSRAVVNCDFRAMELFHSHNYMLVSVNLNKVQKYIYLRSSIHKEKLYRLNTCRVRWCKHLLS